MATRQAAKKTALAVAKPPQVFYRINSLLYTLRAIAQREDQLCVLMHHLRTSGKLNAALTSELHEIIDEIPVQEYTQDVEALRAALQAEVGEPGPGVTRTAKTRSGVKRKAA